MSLPEHARSAAKIDLWDPTTGACSSAQCGISAALAVALLIGQHVQPHGSLVVWLAQHRTFLRHLLARKNCATATQLVGAVITFYGLGRAYIRARYDKTIWEWIASRLLREPQPDVNILAPKAEGRGELTATAYVTLPIDPPLTIPERVTRLERFVNDRSSEGAHVQQKLIDLERGLRRAGDATSELERNILERLEIRVTALEDKFNNLQALDLRWAIGGLAISAVGTAFLFGT